MTISPITRDSDVTLIESISVDRVVANWKRTFNIDPTDEFSGLETIFLYRCNQSGLLFFAPPGLDGSAHLYRKLESFDWYYMEDKLEHDWAEKDLQNCRRALEVGCAHGRFVQQLRSKGIDAIGIELNESACKIAVDRGLPVYLRDMKEMLPKYAGAFDGVCAFQVLEHVSRPREFLSSMIELLAPGGKLVMSVPNSAGFIRHAANDLLNSPPHHVTRWNAGAFRFLESIFPIELVNLKYEPLAKYHIDWYLNVAASRLDSWSRRTVCNRWTRRLMEFDLVRKFIRGHTLYVCFTKLWSSDSALCRPCSFPQTENRR